MTWDDFGQSGPVASSADRKYMRDMNGHLVIVWVAQAVAHHPTPKYNPQLGKKAPMVVVDVIDIDNGYEVIPAMWITGALCYAWNKVGIVGGAPLLGRMRKTGSDQLDPWTFDTSTDPAEREAGLLWLRANGSFVRTGTDPGLEVPFADPYAARQQQPWAPPPQQHGGFQPQAPQYPQQQPAWNQQQPPQQQPYHPQAPIQQQPGYNAPAIQQYMNQMPPGPPSAPPGSPLEQWQRQQQPPAAQDPAMYNQHPPQGQFNPVTGQPLNAEQQRMAQTVANYPNSQIPF